MEARLRLKNITKTYNDLEIFKNFTIDFIPGKINCILGPSGCGKTTLLNIINGSEPFSKGNRKDFEDKKISYVFQEPRLLPWKTVEGNISFVLKDRLKEKEWRKRVIEHLELVQLEEFRKYYPRQLSGGMKQRVSLARAFSFDSDLILMDEPYKALDRKLKNKLISQLIDLWKKEERTIIYVTHEVEEAVKLGHKIFIFSSAPVQIVKEYVLSEKSPASTNLMEEIVELMNKSEHF